MTEPVKTTSDCKPSSFVIFTKFLLCGPSPIITALKLEILKSFFKIAKAFRNIDESKRKRICVETLSDVLLDYGSKETRKWISELITDLGAKGFIMLAVMNPGMHSSEESTALIDLFDGEISITQTKDPLECKTSIRIEKLRNQEYIKNPICIT